MRDNKGRFIKGHNLTKGEKSPLWKGGKPTKICEICNKNFLATRHQLGKFCSIKCRGIASRGVLRPREGTFIKRECLLCFTVFEARTYEVKKGWGKYCSVLCRAKARTREKAANWKGGITPENKRIRNSKKYSEWRTFCMKRDNYTCQLCGIRGGYLEVDHIKPFASFPELRLDYSNGRTLCKPCHEQTPTYRKPKNYAKTS